MGWGAGHEQRCEVAESTVCLCEGVACGVWFAGVVCGIGQGKSGERRQYARNGRGEGVGGTFLPGVHPSSIFAW